MENLLLDQEGLTKQLVVGWLSGACKVGSEQVSFLPLTPLSLSNRCSYLLSFHENPVLVELI